MGDSWFEVLEPLGVGEDYRSEPLKGDEQSFGALSAHYSEVAEVADSLSSSFKNIITGESLSIKGQAAGALAELVEDVGLKLELISPVARNISSLLASHRDLLLDLQQEATTSYNRACVRWNTYQDIKNSANNVEFGEVNVVEPSSAELDSALSDLKDSKSDYDSIVSNEARYDNETANSIREIQLGDLEDPAWWEKVLNKALDIVSVILPVEAILEFVQAVKDGDWERALWRLRELLVFVGAVLAIVAMVFGGPFILAAFVVAALVFATGVILYSMDSEDPDNPGTKITKTDLIKDGLSVALAGLGWAYTGSNAILAGPKMSTFLKGSSELKVGVIFGQARYVDLSLGNFFNTALAADQFRGYESSQDIFQDSPQQCLENQIDQLEADKDLTGAEEILVGHC